MIWLHQSVSGTGVDFVERKVQGFLGWHHDTGLGQETSMGFCSFSDQLSGSAPTGQAGLQTKGTAITVRSSAAFADHSDLLTGIWERRLRNSLCAPHCCGDY